jgi:hypothetical protein
MAGARGIAPLRLCPVEFLFGIDVDDVTFSEGCGKIDAISLARDMIEPAQIAFARILSF